MCGRRSIKFLFAASPASVCVAFRPSADGFVSPGFVLCSDVAFVALPPVAELSLLRAARFGFLLPPA